MTRVRYAIGTASEFADAEQVGAVLARLRSHLPAAEVSLLVRFAFGRWIFEMTEVPS